MRITRRDVVGSLALGWPFLATPARAKEPPYVPKMVWPAIGESWAFHTTITGQSPKTFTMTQSRAPDILFNGELCCAISSGNVTSVARYQGEPMGVLLDGEIRVRYLDPEPFASWPIQVGNTWEGVVRSLNVPIGRQLQTNIAVKIESYETVTVPAGTFWAFRRHSLAKTSHGYLVNITNWWVPEIGYHAKTLNVTRQPDGTETTYEGVLIALPAIA